MPYRRLDHGPADPPGVLTLRDLQPNDATLALRLGLEHDVVISIQNGIAGTTTTAYMAPPEARGLAVAMKYATAESAERYTAGPNVRIAGGILVVKADKRNDRVLLDRESDRVQLSLALVALADQAETEK